MSSHKKHIVIAGGGWAGLAAAVTLVQHHFDVSLYESSPQLGGRARSIEWNGNTLDNGQHLMIGAYQTLLDLLASLGQDPDTLFERLPHRMLMLDTKPKGNTPAFDLKLPTFPAPLHLLFGVFTLNALSFTDKLRLLIRFNRLLNTPLQQDISVSAWLDSAKLPKTYTEQLLKPICLAALTTHPHQASARAFQSVLQQTFNAPASFTDLLIPSVDLGRVFPEQAARFIQQHGGEIKTRCKLTQLDYQDQRLKATFSDGSTPKMDTLVLACPPKTSANILAQLNETQDIAQNINKLEYEPVATLYLQFSAAVSLPAAMTGILNGTAEWVFERASSGHPEILAVVISAHGPHLELDNAILLQRVLDDLTRCNIQLPELIDSKLITEKRATIKCQPDVDQYRPGIATPINQIKLCGDYVYIEENNQPGLPSTLEGALRSGVKCANHIIKQFNS